MRYWLIMPAAGAGRRFGAQKPKQYAALHGRTVIEWALSPFLRDSRCAGAVVVLAESDPYWAEVATRLEAVATPSSAAGEHRPKLILGPGGSERCESVRNGLLTLRGRAEARDWVLVHDAARPCLSSQDLGRLLEQLESHPVGGLLAAPAADTLKRASGQREVEQTVDRSALWRALTPQMFRYARLLEALESALGSSRYPTDEAQAIEWLGDRPVLVEGSAANLKVTSADDLLVAEALLARAIG
jgi:2-C-methyl-D-erythritol 4-phosphate cytidylyltransferase